MRLFVDVGTAAQYSIPADLIARFALVEISEDDFDRLWDGGSPPA